MFNNDYPKGPEITDEMAERMETTMAEYVKTSQDFHDRLFVDIVGVPKVDAEDS